MAISTDNESDNNNKHIEVDKLEVEHAKFMTIFKKKEHKLEKQALITTVVKVGKYFQ